MGDNIFYVYIRLRGATLTELPPLVCRAIRSNYGETMILSLSVCEEQEIEECLSEKVQFWKESMAKTNFNGAELVIHQIRTSNGGLELSHRMMGAIAEAKLMLSMTYTVCKII